MNASPGADVTEVPLVLPTHRREQLASTASATRSHAGGPSAVTERVGSVRAASEPPATKRSRPPVTVRSARNEPSRPHAPLQCGGLRALAARRYAVRRPQPCCERRADTVQSALALFRFEIDACSTWGSRRSIPCETQLHVLYGGSPCLHSPPHATLAAGPAAFTRTITAVRLPYRRSYLL